MKNLLLAAATVALAAGQAQAGLIPVTNVQMPVNETVNLNNIAPDSPEVYAGQTVFTTTIPSMIYAWCIDLFHDIGLGGGQSLVYNQIPFAMGSRASPRQTRCRPRNRRAWQCLHSR